MEDFYYQLLDEKGIPVSGVDAVSLEKNKKVFHLRKAVKAKCANDLEKVDANTLLVYESKAALDADIASNKTLIGLMPDKKVDMLQTDDDNPLLIVVPERVQATIKKIYVRECYSEVFGLLLKCIDEGKQQFAISGTSGIGKSFFFVYILYRLMDDLVSKTLALKPNRFVYQVGSPGTCEYYCLDLKQLRVFNISLRDVIGFVRQSDTFYVVDGPCMPVNSDCVTLHISSPRQDSFKEYLKQRSPKAWVLPVWTLTELQTCRGYCYMGLLPEMLEERYLYCGGVARSVFHPHYDDYGKTRSTVL